MGYNPLIFNGFVTSGGSGGGGGSVTSVGLALPVSVFSISGSPVTSTGTLTGSFVSQSGNTVFAAPNGSSGTPSFRSLVSADIPSLNYVSSVTASSPLFSSGGLTPNITIQVANTSQNGYLSSTDWNTFNNKQPAGSYITALTGDGTATGPGSVPFTLATVNSNVGSFTYSNITVNAKGLITAASSGAAPVTTLSAVGSSPNANAATISGNTLNLQPFSSSFPGVVSASGGGTSNFLRADGTWATPSGTGITQLTGDVTAGPGSGSQVATLATVNSNVGTFGSSTSIPTFTVNAKGLITAASGNVVIAPAGTLSGTTLNSSVVTSSLTSLGAQSQALNMNSNLINNVTDPSSPQDAATKHYVDNAVAGVNPAVAVQAATTSASDTSGFTYNNGVSGIGAFFTGSVNTPVTIDGYTFTALGQRLLVKNDTQNPSGAFNGIYYVTQVQTTLLAPILTRALDYDQPSDINNTGAIPVINGTINNTTQWVLNSLVNTVGTDPLTFTKFARNPSDYILASAGDINETSFTAADNQSSAANITGFAFANATVRSFDATVSIVRNTTYASYKLYGIQKGSSWEMSQNFTGDSTGITFSITAAGQVQYMSTSTGFTSLIKFRAITTTV